MKWPLTFVALLLVGLVLISCSTKEKKTEGTGGRSEWRDPKAPKTIKSKEITTFAYEFNCTFIGQGKHRIAYDFCSFSLQRRESNASCQVSGHGSAHAAFGHEFAVPLVTLDTLQSLIDEHDLAQYNGIGNHTRGIPEHSGSSLHIEYASGEQISAYDNAFYLISTDASSDLFEFFRLLARDAGHHFLHSEREIREFQNHIAGLWKSLDSLVALLLQENTVKIYEGETLVAEATYYHEYDKLYNNEEGGSFGPYKLIEWRDGLLIGTDESGSETKFALHRE